MSKLCGQWLHLRTGPSLIASMTIYIFSINTIQHEFDIAARSQSSAHSTTDTSTIDDDDTMRPLPTAQLL